MTDPGTPLSGHDLARRNGHRRRRLRRLLRHHPALARRGRHLDGHLHRQLLALLLLLRHHDRRRRALRLPRGRDGRGRGTPPTRRAANRRIDNVVPTVSITDPGANIRGTISLDATASDGGGILNVKIQRSPAGLNVWTDICTDTTSPYSCSTDTSDLGRRRPLRPARDRNRQRRTDGDLDGHEPPRRQHAADRDDDGSGREPARHDHPERHRERHRLGRLLGDDPALARRSRHLDGRLHRPELALLLHRRRHHDVGRRRPLRPAHRGDRRRRQPEHLGHGCEPPRRQHGADRGPHRPRLAAQGRDGDAQRDRHGHGRVGRPQRDDPARPDGRAAPGRTSAPTTSTPYSCAWNTILVARRRLRPARGHDRQRRQRRPTRRSSRTASSTTRRRRPPTSRPASPARPLGLPRQSDTIDLHLQRADRARDHRRRVERHGDADGHRDDGHGQPPLDHGRNARHRLRHSRWNGLRQRRQDRRLRQLDDLPERRHRHAHPRDAGQAPVPERRAPPGSRAGLLPPPSRTSRGTRSRP